MKSSLVATALLLSQASAFTSPSCALNGTVCPSPGWKQWNLTLSTICQPGGGGAFLPPAGEPWGLISLDWSVNEATWNKADKNQSTCEATSIQNCQLIKQQSPDTRCFIYHNMELALQWLESQRAVMYTQPDYFLQYLPGGKGVVGEVYNEPRGEGDQFFWNFSNPAAAEYFISSLLTVVQSDPSVDGTFTDDVTGVPAEHPEVATNTGMTAAQLTQLQYDTQTTSGNLIARLASVGKFNWQAFGGSDGLEGGPSQANCNSWVASQCSRYTAFPAGPMSQSFDKNNKQQSIAGFLVVRPELAVIGYGWESDSRDWDPIFLTQVGEPSSGCGQIAPGVWSRAWTYGNATLNCNTWSATIPHAAGVITTV